MSLHVVLVEPEIPQNTGNVARTCAAVGATLHLVHPLGFQTDERAVRRAGLDYWHLVTVVEHPSVEAFLAAHDGELILFSRRGTRAHTGISYTPECYLVFGSETTGLSESILTRYAGRVVRIPMRDGVRCLNLSNAVAVGVYEALRQLQFPGVQPNDSR